MRASQPLVARCGLRSGGGSIAKASAQADAANRLAGLLRLARCVQSTEGQYKGTAGETGERNCGGT